MLYQYKCSNPNCNHVFHINHPMNETKERRCSFCDHLLNKLFTSSSAIYKTKGFYRTDYD